MKDMREIREELGLTATQVAALTGVTEGTVRNWEKGRQSPKFEVIPLLLKLYGITFEQLVQVVEETKRRHINE